MRLVVVTLLLALLGVSAAEESLLSYAEQHDNAVNFIRTYMKYVSGEMQPKFESEEEAEEWMRTHDPDLSSSDGDIVPEPDSYRNVTGLVTSKGYTCDTYTAVTKDHYELSIQRVANPNVAKQNIVVVLQHGLLDASSTWVMNYPNNSLGFMLADQGFDVWMSNMRGNRYSRYNTKIARWRREFWDWSWDEMASYDLPTIIDYVTDQTGVDQVYYVGHSQGTLTAFCEFSQNKKLEAKVKRFFALAPIITMGHCEGLLPWFAWTHGVVYFWMNLFGNDDILPSTPAMRFAGRTYCNALGLTCEYWTFQVAGPNPPGYNVSRADVYMGNFPDGTSLKNLNHWAQLIYSDKTQMYDYGWLENPFYYGIGHHSAPLYDISKVTVPTALFAGGNDYLADPGDVAHLRQTATRAIVYDKNIDYFQHVDFVWGLEAAGEVYDEIIDQIISLESDNLKK